MNDFNDHSEEGQDVLYADDDTSCVSVRDPEVLKEKIQTKANSTTDWINNKSMVCSSEKT